MKFHAWIKVDNFIVGDIYEAAVEMVQKQLLGDCKLKKEIDLNGMQNDFDLIGGNKIILF